MFVYTTSVSKSKIYSLEFCFGWCLWVYVAIFVVVVVVLHTAAAILYSYLCAHNVLFPRILSQRIIYSFDLSVKCLSY